MYHFLHLSLAYLEEGDEPEEEQETTLHVLEASSTGSTDDKESMYGVGLLGAVVTWSRRTICNPSRGEEWNVRRAYFLPPHKIDSPRELFKFVYSDNEIQATTSVVGQVVLDCCGWWGRE